MVISFMPRAAAVTLVALALAACGGNSATTTSKWKIALMSATGTLQDHNFSQYSWEGAKKGAADIGAKAPATVVPVDSSDYDKDIQAFVDAGYNMIVTVAFDESGATTKAAKKNPNVKFIGVDQSPICVDPQGNLDTTFACKGDPKTLLPNYTSLYFEEDQPGYLAGMVAASISKTKHIAAVGGINVVPPVVRYMQGFQLGAQAIDPSVKVDLAYVSTSDFTKAFNDPVAGKVLGSQLISQNHDDVLFQVAGKTGNGVLDAACAANVYAIGVDVDQYLSYPNADPCLVTSAEKHLSNAVEAAIKQVNDGSIKPGDTLFNAANNGIGISPFHGKDNMITADLKAKLDQALAGMKNGSVKTCPSNCGQP
ncbi:MAG TPA: BMP family ABC transporter substrate-binding protein [Candidatus Dormibacteraeota bacterium]|nr:BMP family ABC transporter substrate-binding protein [Candidatus Dormibacteraeota bacterium]